LGRAGDPLFWGGVCGAFGGGGKRFLSPFRDPRGAPGAPLPCGDILFGRGGFPKGKGAGFPPERYSYPGGFVPKGKALSDRVKKALLGASYWGGEEFLKSQLGGRPSPFFVGALLSPKGFPLGGLILGGPGGDIGPQGTNFFFSFPNFFPGGQRRRLGSPPLGGPREPLGVPPTRGGGVYPPPGFFFQNSVVERPGALERGSPPIWGPGCFGGAPQEFWRGGDPWAARDIKGGPPVWEKIPPKWGGVPREKGEGHNHGDKIRARGGHHTGVGVTPLYWGGGSPVPQRKGAPAGNFRGGAA